MQLTEPCVACGGETAPFGRRLSYLYARCAACGTLQLAPQPTREELARAYAEEYANAGHYEEDADACKLSAHTYYQAVVRALKDHRAAGPVLDYGSGWGGLCEMLLANGFSCQGVELSRDMAAYCQRLGLPVQHGDIAAMQGQTFGALVLCTVFEHLVEHDAWMAQANRLLARGSLFVTLQPTAPFADFVGRLVRLNNLEKPLPALHQVFAPPWHTALFSLKGLETLAGRHGFELLEIRPAPQGRVAGWLGVVQAGLGLVNRLGWAVAGRRWPLLTAHIFVFRKVVA